MRLHPRLFNRFLLVSAVVSAIAIIGFGFRHAGNQERGFQRLLGDGQALLDSLAVTPGSHPVTVLYWASWSDASVDLLRELATDSSGTLIAAYVRDDSTSAARAFDGSAYPHVRILNGTATFQALKTPGIPTRIRYGSDGRLLEAVVGAP